ncbi:MAG: hypothetical protein HKP58_19835 [Desulfatitalea sp.]|nr:hypothetical protein [Desulfatitalea sp.]NNK02669.1 hypothetical protein [Desulfatitalea sp.]
MKSILRIVAAIQRSLPQKRSLCIAHSGNFKFNIRGASGRVDGKPCLEQAKASLQIGQ